MSMTAERPPLTDDTPDRVKVGVAEFAVATGDTLVTTSGLGSCVGVAVADPDAGVAGLAHVMLPEATGDDRGKPAKSVEVGVERLLTALEAAGGDPDAVEAKLAGGSQMFDFSGVSEGVGERNVERSREALAERNVTVVAEDVGGSHGRSLELRPGTWTLTVTSAHEGVVEL
jgi:chemotaxis protein CheD